MTEKILNRPAPGNIGRVKNGTKKSRISSVFVILLVGSITMLGPIIWMLSTSLKTPTEVFAIPAGLDPLSPPFRELSQSLEYFNGMYAPEGITFTTYLINTLIIAGLSCLGNNNFFLGSRLRLRPSPVSPPGSLVSPLPGHPHGASPGHDGSQFHPVQLPGLERHLLSADRSRLSGRRGLQYLFNAPVFYEHPLRDGRGG